MNKTTIELVFKKPRVCSCGATYLSAPSGSKTQIDDGLGGVFFDCKCNSTLFVPWGWLDYKCLECFDREPLGDGNDCVECCYTSGNHAPDPSEGGYCLSCGEHPVAGNWND